MANIDDFFNISADVFVDVQSVNTVAVAEAMSVLNTLEKWLIYEKYFMDYTVRDSAASTGRSRSSVQRTIVQAEEKMRKFLNDSSPKNT